MKTGGFLVLFVVSMTLAGACTKGKAPVSLAPDEAALVSSLGFDESLALELRRAGDGPLARLTGMSEGFESYEAPGLTVPASEKKAVKALARLREVAHAAGYMVFIVERNFGYEPDRLALIRGTDQFEILRIRGTNGINYDIENDEVIARLMKWNGTYPFHITAAGFDFVEAVFISPPPDMNLFAREVYAFCPDVVDQGTGSVEALADEMRKTGTLYLWWD